MNRPSIIALISATFSLGFLTAHLGELPLAQAKMNSQRKAKQTSEGVDCTGDIILTKVGAGYHLFIKGDRHPLNSYQGKIFSPADPTIRTIQKGCEDFNARF